ncbi:hypothetical protein ABIA25_002405 [Sinorhizobium fredii]
MPSISYIERDQNRRRLARSKSQSPQRPRDSAVSTRRFDSAKTESASRRALCLDVVGVEYDEQDCRDAGKQRHIERDIVAPGGFELGDRRCRQNDARGSRHLHQGHQVFDAVDRRPYRAGAFAVILQRSDVGRDRGEGASDEVCPVLGAREDATVAANRQQEHARVEEFGGQIFSEPAFGFPALPVGEELRAVCLESRCRSCCRQADGPTRTGFHSGMLVHDARHARHGHDQQEGDDEDGN